MQGEAQGALGDGSARRAGWLKPGQERSWRPAPPWGRSGAALEMDSIIEGGLDDVLSGNPPDREQRLLRAAGRDQPPAPGRVDARPHPRLRLPRRRPLERSAGMAAAGGQDRPGRPRRRRRDASPQAGGRGMVAAADAGGAGRAQGRAAAGRVRADAGGGDARVGAAGDRCRRWPRSRGRGLCRPAPGDRPARARPPRQDRGRPANGARPADAVGRGGHELRRRSAARRQAPARPADRRAGADDA